MTAIVSTVRRYIEERRSETQADTEECARSFLAIRKAVGYLALWLPIVLLVVGVASSDFKPSISAFYYTVGRNVFVGTLFAIGIFLIAYTGHKKAEGDWFAQDFWVSKVAGLAVLEVAFVPTQATSSDLSPWPYTSANAGLVQAIHTGSAVLFFACLAYFSGVLFRRGNESVPGKKARNRIYLGCALVIVASIALIAVVTIWSRGSPDQVELNGLHPTFWLEAVAVWAFAVSWLTKGKSVLIMPLEALAASKKDALVSEQNPQGT